MYCKHKEYKEKINAFVHSDIVARNESKHQAIFELISLNMKTGVKHSEFKVTINAEKDEPVPDWIEDEIKKNNNIVTAQFTTTHDSTIIQCPRITFNENLSYKLTETMNNLSCEFSSIR